MLETTVYRGTVLYEMLGTLRYFTLLKSSEFRCSNLPYHWNPRGLSSTGWVP